MNKTQISTKSSEQLVKYFCTAISTQHWNLNFFRFCEVVGIEPGEEDSGQRLYAFEKFKQFSEATSALNTLGTDFLKALVEDYYNK
ncbi:hypothetical protein M595_1220 [Lyngbya aestuarii BL J]|uniref:Uncharacterized protein n=1 Tax=Lyngbya aestuarii BL J TaxID=1348334 RepID=U7QNH4_9CYAN|nr:hypothetical protein [Lyngbya aestuarii]ERT08675.1 hypothetical protein M595_1220 [Lyngbya aestuarii BL J]